MSIGEDSVSLEILEKQIKTTRNRMQQDCAAGVEEDNGANL